MFLGHPLIFVSLKEIHTLFFFFQKQTHTEREWNFYIKIYYKLYLKALGWSITSNQNESNVTKKRGK